jgi:hypothetical protein
MSVQLKGSGTISGLDEGLVVSGIVTSSTQINVGSNIKIGNAGVVTATTFSGSGASLTNLPAGNLTGALPAISGANLTGLTVPGGATNLDLLDSSGTGNGRIRIGASQDLQIYHDGSHSWLKNTTGRLLLQTDGDQIQLRGNTIVAFNGAASTEYLRIDSSGNMGLGIGGAISDARFRIKGANNTTSSFNDGLMVTSNNETVYKKYSWMGIEAQGGIIFSEATSSLGETMRINSSGQMGLGTQTPQANAKLHVVGNVGASQFYTTSTSTPQTDFTSSVTTNKAGLLLHRLSETSGDYGGIEFHNHPSSITSYRKGGIYFQSDGSGFGRGDMVFVNDGTGDANNLSISDEKLRIHREGYLTSPHQVSFYATANSGGTVSMSSTHILTNWRLSTSGRTYSIGGHFNTSNGRFTAPVTGKYLFTSSILLAGYDQANSIHMIWRKNGSNFQYWYNTRTSDIDRSGYGGYLAQGSTTTMTLDANDYIDVACNFGGSLSLWCGDANWGHFSGHLLG